MNVGDISIEAVLDGVIAAPARDVLVKRDDPDAWSAHRDLLNDAGELELYVGGFLIRTGDRVVLVDAGLGPFDRDGFRSGRLLDSLAAMDVSPQDITDVLLTHLHFDHVGWVAQKGDVVFSNATYRCHSGDWEHFVTGPDAEPGAVRKLTPIADRLETFSGDNTVASGIDVRDAPGHTPGSAVVVVSSGADRALLVGDVVHCPIEFTDLEWEAAFDVDPALAKRTREALARELEGSDVPIAAAHFPGLASGRLLSGSDGMPQWTYDV